MCLVSKRKYLEVVEQNKILSDYSSEVSKENDELANENDQLRVEVEKLSDYIEEMDEAYLLLIKELLHCWNLRSKHKKDRNKDFTEAEWKDTISIIREGLESCLLEVQTSEDLDKIEKMSDLLERFNGEL